MKQKLEDDELWKAAIKLAEETYNLIQEFPDEEKFGMISKLRSRSFEVSSDIAEAVGTINPRDRKHSLELARRSLFSLKNVFKLAARTEIYNVEPEIFLLIDKLVDDLDIEIETTTKAIPAYYMEQFGGANK